MKQKNNLLKTTATNDDSLDHLAHHSLLSLAWRRFRRHRLAFASLFVIAIYTVLTLTSPILPIYSYRVQVSAHAHLRPSFGPVSELLREKLDKKHQRLLQRQNLSELTPEMLEEQKELEERIATEKMVDGRGREVFTHQRRYLLGTDSLGRDMLSRTLYGGRVSILIGLIGAAVSVIIGVIIGSIAGYIGGLTDFLIIRFIDVLAVLPFTMIVIILSTIFGRDLVNFFIAIAALSWLGTARLMRGMMLTLRNSTFIEVSSSMGASSMRLIFIHLVPNCLGLIIIGAAMAVPSFIMYEAFLSYLGLGIQPPLSSWGSLLAGGTAYMRLYPWRMVVPAIAMGLFLVVVNFLGDGLRDAFDPKVKVGR